MSIFIWAFLGAKGLRPTYTLGNTVAVPLFPFVATHKHRPLTCCVLPRATFFRNDRFPLLEESIIPQQRFRSEL